MWTAEEQAAKLASYLEVPRECWELAKHGTHVRYFTKAEGYRPGGFVCGNPVEFPEGEGAADGAPPRRGLRLQSAPNSRMPGTFYWNVAYDDLDKLYSKADAGAMTVMVALESAVRGLNDNIRRLAEHAKKLEARLHALESGAPRH